MFYVSGFDKDNRLWKVTDSKDGVEESYSFKDLKKFESQGIEILGMSKNCCHKCIVIDNFIIVPDITNNAIAIKNLLTSSITIFYFDDIKNNRNRVWFTGNFSVKKVKDSICISCGVCVKYDIEFTGTYLFKINSNGLVIDKLDDVLFVCDDSNEVYDWIKSTNGDCPNFITSLSANRILKSKGMV